MGDCLCDQCAALCCRYFALPIDNPDCARDFDNIRWYLCHENVVIFVEKKQWYIGLMNRCKHLQPDNRCGIYHTRPKLCREYSAENCDYHGGDYNFELLFTSAEVLREYGEKTLAEARKKRRRKALRRGKSPRRPGAATKAALRALAAQQANNGKNGSSNGSGNGQAAGALVPLTVPRPAGRGRLA